MLSITRLVHRADVRGIWNRNPVLGREIWDHCWDRNGWGRCCWFISFWHHSRHIFSWWGSHQSSEESTRWGCISWEIVREMEFGRFWPRLWSWHSMSFKFRMIRSTLSRVWLGWLCSGVWCWNIQCRRMIRILAIGPLGCICVVSRINFVVFLWSLPSGVT